MKNLKQQFERPFEVSNSIKATGYVSGKPAPLIDDMECTDDLNPKGCLLFLFISTFAAIITAITIINLLK